MKTVFTYVHVKWFYDQSEHIYYLNYFILNYLWRVSSVIRSSKLWLFWSPWQMKIYFAANILVKVANWQPPDKKKRRTWKINSSLVHPWNKKNACISCLSLSLFLSLSCCSRYANQHIKSVVIKSNWLVLSTQLIILNYPVILSHRCSTKVSSEIYPLYSFIFLYSMLVV